MCVDELWSKDRFKSLVCSDPVKKQQDFGTFPQISTSKQSKVSVESLGFTQVNRSGNKEAGTKSLGAAENTKERMSGKLKSSNSRVQPGLDLKPATSTKTSGNPSLNLLSSDSEGRLLCGSSGSSGDSGVEMAGSAEHRDPHLPYTVGDITDCLYKSSDDFGFADADVGASKGVSEKNASERQIEHDASVQSLPQAKLRSLSAEKKSDFGPVPGMKVVSKKMSLPSSSSTSLEEEDTNNVNVLLGDSTVQEGFQAIALLNDVLKDYSDLNESCTDDAEGKDGGKEAFKGKKSSDFEARMASVAATLDLTKPQQRGKRQAPRPPVSPPPEPNLALGVSPKKVVNQPDPVFKMVTVGKSIVNLPPQQDGIAKNSKPAIISYGLEDFGSLPENCDSINKTNGDGKSKKGITSFFRNILRRGKDSQESFESANPDVHFSAKPERKDSAGVIGSVDQPDDDMASSCVDQKLAPKFSPQAKFLVIPPTSPSQKRGDADSVAQASASADAASKSELDSHLSLQENQSGTAPAASPSATAASESPATASPQSQRKASKGLASPKMMLKKATAKFSPPACRHKVQEKEPDAPVSSTIKPYPAPKPVMPPPAKPPVTAASSLDAAPVVASVKDTSVVKDGESVTNPNVIRRRPKSPKRTAPPVPPTRTSVGTGE